MRSRRMVQVVVEHEERERLEHQERVHRHSAQHLRDKHDRTQTR